MHFSLLLDAGDDAAAAAGGPCAGLLLLVSAFSLSLSLSLFVLALCFVLSHTPAFAVSRARRPTAPAASGGQPATYFDSQRIFPGVAPHTHTPPLNRLI